MISEFIASYGYVAVFAGTLLEGETVLVAAGFAAHRGMLDLPVVIAVAIAGSTLGDQLAFFFGRYKGNALIERVPALAKRKVQIDALLSRHDILFVVSVRFFYGFRIVGPLIIGASGLQPWRFVMLSLLGATLWAGLVCGLGYSLGVATGPLLANLKGAEEIILACIFDAGLLFLVWYRFMSPRHQRHR